jgi:deoxyhypusine monooxygenase
MHAALTPASPALRDPSALFRHDVAFCMGQRQDPAAIGALQALLRDGSEHPM